MRWTSIAIPDDAFTVAEASKRLDVSVTHVRRLIEEGCLQRVDVEGCPILVTQDSVHAYDEKRAKPGDRRLIVVVRDGLLTPSELASAAGWPIESLHSQVEHRLTADGFRVYDKSQVENLKKVPKGLNWYER